MRNYCGELPLKITEEDQGEEVEEEKSMFSMYISVDAAI